MRRIALGAVALLASACVKNPYSYEGYAMDKFFPFDGSFREWTFVSDDETVGYKLVATMLDDVMVLEEGTVHAHTVEFMRECLGGEGCEDGWDHTYKLSSDGGEGVLLYHWDSPETGPIDYDPPIIFAKDRMVVDDQVESEGGGSSVVSTFKSLEPCDIEWTDEWNECAKIEVDGTPDAPFEATYWAVTSYNIVAWQAVGETGPRWSLATAEWTPDE